MQKSSWQIGFWAFGTSFVAFFLLFLGIMGLAQPNAAGMTAAAVTEKNDYQPEPSDAITVLFMGGAIREETPGLFVLARFDPAQKRIAMTVLPGPTAVWNGSDREPMAEVYRYGGADYTRKALQKTLGLPIDRYVWLSAADFLKIAGLLGTVEAEIHQPVALNRHGAVIQLGIGRQLLDGTKGLALLQYYQKENQTAAINALLEELVNQRIDIALTSSLDTIFRQIVNMAETDITYMDYDNRKQAAAWLAQNRAKFAPAYVMTAQGLWQQNDRLFLLTDTFSAQLLEIFHGGIRAES